MRRRGDTRVHSVCSGCNRRSSSQPGPGHWRRRRKVSGQDSILFLKRDSCRRDFSAAPLAAPGSRDSGLHLFMQYYSHVASGSSFHRTSATGPAKITESSRSSNPPKPGSSSDESFFWTSRLIRDSARSPTSPVTPTIAP